MLRTRLPKTVLFWNGKRETRVIHRLPVLYSEFATATELSAMLDGDMNLEPLTCCLSASEYFSKDLWRGVKVMVRQVEQADGCLSFDDNIQGEGQDVLERDHVLAL